MRLLKRHPDGTFTLTADLADGFPPYAILSHTWGPDDQEVDFTDMMGGTGQLKDGYRKLEFCGSQAALDGLEYFWVDTCCINKANSTELQEAINSMFRWYQQAQKCYVYLPDVTFGSGGWTAAFQQSRWLTRGWTLQELIAPSSVEFFSKEGQRLGDKQSLGDSLQQITGIPIGALRGAALAEFGEAERMSWSDGRSTKKEEDMAYCLLGLFNVHMPLIYGEGKKNALRRLREEIAKQSGFQADRKTHFIVPFGKNRSFVGREQILAWLLDRIHPSMQENDCQRTIIEGLGGVGKTQIALEAAYRLRERCPNCSVFWVPVVSMAAFEKAYREIGQALNLQAVEDDRADVKALVNAALSRQSAGNWLMVVDNADDEDLLIGNGEDASVTIALPFSPKGSILFTTRNRTVATLLDVGPKEVVAVDGMNRADAIKMLHGNLEVSQVDEESTEKLIEILAYLPLAIKQASAYMRRNGISTQKYLGYCLTSDKSQTRLLCQGFEDCHRYSSISNPVATTWNITFTQISQKWPLAADSMKLVCHYAEKDIPIELFPGKDDMEKNEAIGVLKGYGFVSERETSEAFDIHRLVRLAMRNWIRDKGKARRWTELSVRRLNGIFPTPRVDSRNVWLEFLPHAQALLERQEDCCNKELIATLTYKVARSHQALGNYVHAEQLYRTVLNLKDKELCPKHSIIWDSMYRLGITLSELEKHAEAESILRQAIKAKTNVLGRTKDADTLNAMLWLADSLGEQGKYAEAEKMTRKTRRRMLDVLGLKHPHTIRSGNALALILASQRKYLEAEKMLRQTERIGKEVLGQESPQRLISLSNLARVLVVQGLYEEAERTIQATIESSERVFGNEHPNTLKSRHNLGCMFVRQGRYVEAEKILKVTVELTEKVWGSMHPFTVASKKFLQIALDGLAK